MIRLSCSAVCCAEITTCVVRSSLLDTPRRGIASARRVRVMAAVGPDVADDADKAIAADMVIAAVGPAVADEPCCVLCGDKVDPLKKVHEPEGSSQRHGVATNAMQ